MEPQKQQQIMEPLSRDYFKDVQRAATSPAQGQGYEQNAHQPPSTSSYADSTQNFQQQQSPVGQGIPLREQPASFRGQGQDQDQLHYWHTTPIDAGKGSYSSQFPVEQQPQQPQQQEQPVQSLLENTPPPFAIHSDQGDDYSLQQFQQAQQQPSIGERNFPRTSAAADSPFGLSQTGQTANDKDDYYEEEIPMPPSEPRVSQTGEAFGGQKDKEVVTVATKTIQTFMTDPTSGETDVITTRETEVNEVPTEQTMRQEEQAAEPKGMIASAREILINTVTSTRDKVMHTLEGAKDTLIHTAQTAKDTTVHGVQGAADTVAHTAQAAKDTAAHTAHVAKDKSAQTAEAAKHTTESIATTARPYLETAKEKTFEMAGKAKEATSYYMHEGQHIAAETSERVKPYVNEAKHRVQETAQPYVEEAKSSLEEIQHNPAALKDYAQRAVNFGFLFAKATVDTVSEMITGPRGGETAEDVYSLAGEGRDTTECRDTLYPSVPLNPPQPSSFQQAKQTVRNLANSAIDKMHVMMSKGKVVRTQQTMKEAIVNLEEFATERIQYIWDYVRESKVREQLQRLENEARHWEQQIKATVDHYRHKAYNLDTTKQETATATVITQQEPVQEQLRYTKEGIQEPGQRKNAPAVHVVDGTMINSEDEIRSSYKEEMYPISKPELAKDVTPTTTYPGQESKKKSLTGLSWQLQEPELGQTPSYHVGE